MNIIYYTILGIIQGFTEPIPVSSSGHLVIFRELFNLNFLYDLNFEIIVNFGSFIAIAFFYRKDIANIFKDFFCYIKTKKNKYKDNFNYAWLIVIGTIPAGILGFIFKDYIERFSNAKTVGVALLMTAGLLFIIRNLKGTKDDKRITFKDALLIGIYQVFALLPGISRSGMTIFGGMVRGLKREAALKYSFMLYFPISIAAMILGVNDLLHTSNFINLLLPYTFGMIAACVVTYYSLKWYKDIMIKGKLIYFVYYCVIAGILTIIFL